MSKNILLKEIKYSSKEEIFNLSNFYLQSGDFYNYCSNELLKDKEICRMAILGNKLNIILFPQELKDKYGENPQEFIENIERENELETKKPKSRSLVQDNTEADEIMNSINQSKDEPQTLQSHTAKKSKYDRE